MLREIKSVCEMSVSIIRDIITKRVLVAKTIADKNPASGESMVRPMCHVRKTTSEAAMATGRREAKGLSPNRVWERQVCQ
jgi:hypothetical protein